MCERERELRDDAKRRGRRSMFAIIGAKNKKLDREHFYGGTKGFVELEGWGDRENIIIEISKRD